MEMKNPKAKIVLSPIALEAAYKRLGSLVAMQAEFNCSYSTIKRRMIEFGLYTSTPKYSPPIINIDGVETKECIQCKEIKNIIEFYIREDSGKYRNECKECVKNNRKQYRKDNPEIIKDTERKKRKKHKDKIKKRTKIWRENNIEMVRLKLQEYKKERRKNDPIFKLRSNISRSINRALKANGSAKKDNSIFDYLSYSVDELKAHIESLFESWMMWSNYGPYNSKTWNDNDQSTWTWQLDHIMPHSTFNYTTMDCQEFRDCWALSNLRPLSAKQNQLDGVTRIRHQSI